MNPRRAGSLHPLEPRQQIAKRRRTDVVDVHLGNGAAALASGGRELEADDSTDERFRMMADQEVHERQRPFALALAKLRPDAHVFGSDVSAGALEIALSGT